LDAGAPVNRTSNLGDTPLCKAVEIEMLEMVHLLVKHGADVNQRRYYVSPPTIDSPLALAAHSGNIKTVSYLVEAGAELDAMNSGGRTALGIATAEGYTEIVHYLQSKGSKSTSFFALVRDTMKGLKINT